MATGRRTANRGWTPCVPGPEVALRQILLAAVALVVGVIVGGILPRARVRGLEAELAAAEECQRGGMGSEIASMLGGARAVEDRRRDEVPDVPDAGDTEGDALPGDDAAEGGVEVRLGDDEDAPESMAAMREALELRRTQARAALV